MFQNTDQSPTPHRFPLHSFLPPVSMDRMDLPKNKSAQAAQHLKLLMEKGHFGTTLPSERYLSEQLLISRNCVREALSILTKEGAIAPPSQSKRRQILVDQSKPTKTPAQRCIILSPTPEHKSPSMLLSQLASLRKLLLSSKISVEIKSSQAFRQKDVADTLGALVQESPNSIWVLHQCPEIIQAWFEASGLPAIIFGSAFPHISIPSVDSDHAAGVRHAAGQLLRLGHTHIALVVPRTTLAGAQNAEQGLVEAIAHSPTEIKHTVIGHDFNVPRLTNKLNSLLRVKSPPTAFIVQNHHHFLTIYSHLMSMGIKIPQYVSIISMADDASFERLCPTPSCYSTGSKVLRALASAISNIQQKTIVSNSILPEFHQGQTIGLAPKNLS